MTIFDQRGQRVTYQYNAAGNIDFGSVKNTLGFVDELEKLKAEITRAGESQLFDPEIVTDTQYQIQKAVEQARKPDPDKSTILDHLGKAKEFIEGLVNTGGIVAGIVKAIEIVRQLF